MCVLCTDTGDREIDAWLKILPTAEVPQAPTQLNPWNLKIASFNASRLQLMSGHA